jgi:hypothetical protein
VSWSIKEEQVSHREGVFSERPFPTDIQGFIQTRDGWGNATKGLGATDCTFRNIREEFRRRSGGYQSSWVAQSKPRPSAASNALLRIIAVFQIDIGPPEQFLNRFQVTAGSCDDDAPCYDFQVVAFERAATAAPLKSASQGNPQ